MHRSHFPRVGQVFLSGHTFYPRNNHLVGQNVLRKYVPWILIPADRFSCDTEMFYLPGMQVNMQL